MLGALEQQMAAVIAKFSQLWLGEHRALSPALQAHGRR
jgi:hypothetical protein